MKQVVIVGGGETHETYEDYLAWLGNQEFNLSGNKPTGWKDTLQEDLGKDFQVIRPRMPDSQNAEYEEWEIYFNTVVAELDDQAVFVGHSLGGLFLLNYLSNHFLAPRATMLIATPAHDCGSFMYPGTTGKDLGKVHIFQSLDDTVVDPGDAYRIKADILSAELHISKDSGHFYMQTNFPDLVRVIKSSFPKKGSVKKV